MMRGQVLGPAPDTIKNPPAIPPAASPKLLGITMLYWAVIFFIVALAAAVLGFTGLAGDLAYIGKIIAVIGIILAIISFIASRRSARG
jgi:uncharacterized membrane protein YtjA (UPF0391 family)